MNIKALCNPNCVLLMWVTFPCLEQGLELGKASGFRYKTVAFTWIKTNKNNENVFLGMRYYTKANAEIVLLFTKGKPLVRHAKNVSQVVVSPLGKHSEKPNEIRKRMSVYLEMCQDWSFLQDKIHLTVTKIFSRVGMFLVMKSIILLK